MVKVLVKIDIKFMVNVMLDVFMVKIEKKVFNN